MKPKQLLNMGYKQGPVIGFALKAAQAAKDAGQDAAVKLAEVLASPASFQNDPIFGAVAACLYTPEEPSYVPDSKDYPIWGEEGIDENSKNQMGLAMEMPCTVAGALMPDAHLGYGLPIGGVVAFDNAVTPMGVGVDIACRMKLSVLNMPSHMLVSETDRLKNAIERETRFGVGAEFKGSDRNDHKVMEDPLWAEDKFLGHLKDKAWSQLGSSGSGNHFVEFGIITINEAFDGLVPGEYMALLSHSGSRGLGAAIADKYHKIAVDLLPKRFEKYKGLAWLDLDTEEGQAYWAAMNLAGRYASANHEMIHRRMAKNLKTVVMGGVENHHNFAWIERHGDRELVVHRKGATPAGMGQLGVIPGSMADPCFVVRGKGEPTSLNSSSHGAGRVMSRKQAKSTFTWSEWKKKLDVAGIELISAGLDEVPGVYKNIRDVIARQRDLIDTIAEFQPKIVKMADGGRAED